MKEKYNEVIFAPKKIHLGRLKLSFLILLMLVLFTCPITVFAQETENPLAASTVTLNIETPSVTESTLSSGRNFYVLGSIENGSTVPEDALMTVTLKNADGTVVRQVSTNIKNNQSLATSIKNDAGQEMLSFYGKDRELLKTSGMPELVVTEGKSFYDATQKCYYNDTGFHALMAGGSDLDQMNWTDENNRAYAPILEGSYTLTAPLESQGTALAQTEKLLTIGTTAHKTLARFSPNSHFSFVKYWAAQNDFRVYLDAFTGYWGWKDLGVHTSDTNTNFCEIKPEWRAADASEYFAGKTHCVLYNMKESSSSYSVELGALQNQGVIDDANRMAYYYYSIGEPSLTTPTGDVLTAELSTLPMEKKLAFTRSENIQGETQENIYKDTDAPQVKTMGFDLNQGITGFKTVTHWRCTALWLPYN